MIFSKIYRSPLGFVVATAVVAVFTAALHLLEPNFRTANISMLYLLLIALTALFLGRGPAIWTSITAFLLCNWYFVSPRHTFHVAESGEWISLCVFLITAMIISQLMASIQASASAARRHYKETAAIADASWAIASQLDTNSALDEILRQISLVLNIDCAFIVSIDNDDSLKIVAGYPESRPDDLSQLKLLSEFKATMTETSGEDQTNATEQSRFILPVALNEQLLGYIYLRFKTPDTLGIDQRHMLAPLISHTVLIFQRDNWLRQAAASAALAQADRLKTALLSMISHDFRSPLTSIKASISTLSQNGEPLSHETVQSLYQTIEEETDRLNRMVGNILDLSRLEASAWRLRLEPTPISEIIGMALNSFDKVTNSRINVQLDPELPELKADCTQIVQVLKNLLENAVKYSPADSQIELKTRAENDFGIFEVMDRGSGLPTQNISDMFEPFWRAPDLYESSTPGIGIGLTICRGLVEAHGGYIQAEPRQGGGSTFSVYLPRYMSAEIEQK